MDINLRIPTAHRIFHSQTFDASFVERFPTKLGWSFVMKRMPVLLCLLAGLLGGTGAVATAAPEPIGTFTFTLKECGFRIEGVLTGKSNFIELPGGALLTSPGQEVTLTNVKTRESVTYVITGSSHITTSASGNQTITATGRNVLTIPVGDRKGVYLTVGSVTYVLDSRGRQVSPFEGDAQVTNICELLA
ncbi:hypothetical protein [Arthrobacter sp. Bi83]|uniref:hypothetical protein n=1 Tax=Arthrobacter sp. Bi83 TaxID=2822353 RepID=UPI001E592E2D|nr:hypothetical protein [Arthrobacter sp. Bi83]